MCVVRNTRLGNLACKFQPWDLVKEKMLFSSKMLTLSTIIFAPPMLTGSLIQPPTVNIPYQDFHGSQASEIAIPSPLLFSIPPILLATILRL